MKMDTNLLSKTCKIIKSMRHNKLAFIPLGSQIRQFLFWEEEKGMKYITIGMLIKETRKAHKNMTSQKLSRGICSVQMLYQIEKDQCDTDLLMTDMLLQRLGKSPDKLERILQNDMYHMVRVRELLKKAILKGKRTLAEQILTRYPSRTNVDKMYQQRMKACLLYYIDKDHDAAFSCLQAAVHATLPGFSYDAIDDYLISTVEMENLLALERIRIERKTDVEKTTEKKHLRSCMGYIDRHFTDDEEHAKIYAKCAWLLARIEYHDGNYMQTIVLCESGLEGLRRNTMIYFALPLLKLMVQAGEQLGVAPDRSKWVQYYETLDFLWSSFAEPWCPVDMIFHNCYQKEYHLDYELVRDERKAQGITQEEFADGIYQDTGSLSRFETGRISPNKKNFGKILEKLGIEKGRYSGYVVTDSFDTMELKCHLDQLMMRRRYDAAGECLKELKQCLDLEIEENRVLVTFEEILIAYLTGEVNAQEALENVKGLLKGFMDCDKMIFYHVPMRNEALIINNVCILLYETGQETLAMRLFQSILQRMDDSKVDVRYRYRSYALLFNNYVRRNRGWKDACKELKYEFVCGKAMVLPFSINNILIVLEKMGISDEDSDRWAKAIYYMSDLYYFHKEKEIYKVYLLKDRNVNILD